MGKNRAASQGLQQHRFSHDAGTLCRKSQAEDLGHKEAQLLDECRIDSAASLPFWHIILPQLMGNCRSSQYRSATEGLEIVRSRYDGSGIRNASLPKPKIGCARFRTSQSSYLLATQVWPLKCANRDRRIDSRIFLLTFYKTAP
jgi:hypothetical protein